MYGKKAVSETQLCKAVFGRLPSNSVAMVDAGFGIFGVVYSAVQHGHDIISRLTEQRLTKDLSLPLHGRDVGNQVMQKARQEMAARREKHMSKELPAGVYVKAVLDFFIKSEVSRAVRYDLPFSALLVSFQGLPEDKAGHETHGDALRGLQNVLIGDLRKYLRDCDFVGYLTFNRFLVVLPMTTLEAAPRIIKKFQENLNRQVALPNGTRLSIRPRCGLAAFEKNSTNSYPKIYAELVKSWQAAG